jgi:hypothetical protein
MMARIRNDEEGVNPLERGRRLYQQKDYTGALEAFSNVGPRPRGQAIHPLSYYHT